MIVVCIGMLTEALVTAVITFVIVVFVLTSADLHGAAVVAIVIKVCIGMITEALATAVITFVVRPLVSIPLILPVSSLRRQLLKFSSSASFPNFPF